MISGIIATAGIILVVGICNNAATMTEIIIYSAIGIALVAISVLFARNTCYLEFIAPNGRMKTIRVNNLAAKLRKIHKYEKNGYKFYSEWERN